MPPMSTVIPLYSASLLLACRSCVPLVRSRTSIFRRCRKRDSVQLTIYNSEDITLVRETRIVTFKKGVEPAAVLLGEYADRPIQSSS